MVHQNLPNTKEGLQADKYRQGGRDRQEKNRQKPIRVRSCKDGRIDSAVSRKKTRSPQRYSCAPGNPSNPSLQLKNGGSAIRVSNHFTIGRDLVRIWRSNFVSPPFLFVNIEPGVTHTFRVEHFTNELYVYYIDGQIVDSGVPQGAFPNISARIIWGSQMREEPNTSHWDYIRYGVIPQAHSGDFDSNGVVDDVDLYFFADCLLGPDYDAAGPGCVWADMNADGTANGADVAAFVDAMIGA